MEEKEEGLLPFHTASVRVTMCAPSGDNNSQSIITIRGSSTANSREEKQSVAEGK